MEWIHEEMGCWWDMVAYMFFGSFHGEREPNKHLSGLLGLLTACIICMHAVLLCACSRAQSFYLRKHNLESNTIEKRIDEKCFCRAFDLSCVLFSTGVGVCACVDVVFVVCRSSNHPITGST